MSRKAPNHRPESQPRPSEHQQDQQPGRGAQTLVEPDPSESEDDYRNGELQTHSGELSAGYAFRAMQQAVVLRLLAFRVWSRSVRQRHLASTTKLELVKFFSSDRPSKETGPGNYKCMRDRSHYQRVTCGR